MARRFFILINFKNNFKNLIKTELWLITEYHERGSLFDYLLENTLTQELCIKMTLCIISGVDQLHKGNYFIILKN